MSAGVLLDLYPIRGLRIVRGDGAYLETADGNRLLDLGSNYGVSIFGYRHPAVNTALTAQLEALPTLHGSFGSDVRVKASLALSRRLPMQSPAVCWTNSGTEAVEAALKFAVLASGRRRFVACRGAYHGKTLGSLSATDSKKHRAPFEPLPWEVAQVEFGDAQALRDAIDERTAAVIVEPIQGEGGIVVPPAGYLSAVRQATRDAGVLLIVDEIQTGCGRTGRFLACDHEAVSPDIVCLGKGLAGGVPVGVTAVTRAVAEHVPRGIHTSTFGGNPLACAGAMAVLGLLTDERLAAVARSGAGFLERLRAETGHDGAVRGVGLMAGLAAGRMRDATLKELQRRGVIALPAGEDVVRFLPPFVVSDEDLDRAARLVGDVVKGLSAFAEGLGGPAVLQRRR